MQEFAGQDAPGAAGRNTSNSEICVPRYQLKPPWSVGRVLADTDQQVLADRVQVGRVAEHLQLAEHLRLAGCGEVDRVEGIDLAKRHDVADVVDEPHRVDPLAVSEPATRPTSSSCRNSSKPSTVTKLWLSLLGMPVNPHRVACAGHAQEAAVFRHRELVEQEARTSAAALVGGAVGLRDVEPVDLRRLSGHLALGILLHPRRSRHVEVPRQTQ